VGGIAGAFRCDGGEVSANLLSRMTSVIGHRGPDDEGYLLVNAATGRAETRTGDGSAGGLKQEMAHVLAPTGFSPDGGLGHRRLAIVDLSEFGHQPMGNEDGTVWVVHDGEVYNLTALREELEGRGHAFRSLTDTEVVLHAYEEWGADCLSRFNGEWAFAIWDVSQSKLFCGRDRFGVKPLYYYFDGRTLLVASEIKAILEADFVERRANDQAVFDYLVYWAEDCGEETFFSGIKRVPAGHYLEFRPQGAGLQCRRYYHVRLEDKLLGWRDEEYAARFREFFEDSVRLRLTGDAPVGASLSGGLDSSSIVCMIDSLVSKESGQYQGSHQAVKTFSARFEDKRHDEGRFIAAVEEKASVDGRHVRPTGEGLMRDLSRIVWHQEEPFRATWAYAKWEAYKLARESGTKVSIDGQGGDELLAGYDRMFAVLFAHLFGAFQWLSLTREMWAHVRLRGRTGLADMPRAAYHLLPQSLRPLVRRATRVDSGSFLDKEFASSCTGYLFRDGFSFEEGSNVFDAYLYQVFARACLPSLLRHEDRSSMAHSLEYRAPFLDHRLVEYALALPWDQKIRHGTRKLVLRNAMKGILPDAVAERQDKIGLSTPEETWLRTDLRDLVGAVVHSSSFRQRPYFDPKKTREIYTAFEEGRPNLRASIWQWVCLELWLRKFIDGGGRSAVPPP
jgi:asparagine synthase (glutamine-hydrolysing)